MVALPTYGGPLKREIIKRAYGLCGQAAWEFELDPEEFTAGLQLLNDQMAMLGPLTGYNAPEAGDGDSEEESGIAAGDVLGVTVCLARSLAPTIGKMLSLSAVHARAESAFLAKCTPIPQMELGRNTIRGAGNRWGRWRGPFFATDISPDEIPQ